MPAQLTGIFLGLCFLVLVVVLVGYGIRMLVIKEPTPTEPTEQVLPPLPQKPSHYEIFPSETETKPEIPESPPETVKVPRVCIIIDDMGYDRKLAKQFLSLDVPLTFSILPFSPFQQEIHRHADSNGTEIMLHLPMEPNEYPQVDPGPGALLTSMSPDELIDQLIRDIRSVPGAKGINNHMGSKMTAVSSQMYQIFTILKKEGLYFIDSRTSAETLCKPSARLLKVPFAERDIFLDHITTSDFIKKQLKKLVLIAQRNGSAIGIAHPYPETYQVLKEMLPVLKKQVQLVPASALVERLG